MDSSVCRTTTICLIVVCVIAAAPSVHTQELRLDWRRIGNSAIREHAIDLATGPIDRVWFTPTGLAAKLKSGDVWESTDGEIWKPSKLNPPEQAQRESGGRTYKADVHALRSDDGGDTWTNLTEYRGYSILGGALTDIAVSPRDPNDILAGGSNGVWRSLDGGDTWAGLNQTLPNLPVKQILDLPAGVRGIRIATADSVLEWHPGQKMGWSIAPTPLPNQNIATESRGDYMYFGFADGRILVTQNGVARPMAQTGAGRVERFWVDPRDPATALAVTAGKVFRTFNGGRFWDDVTGTLQAGPLHGVTADRTSGSIYVAGDSGVFYAVLDFTSVTPANNWRKLASPASDRKAVDIRLDSGSNQLYVAFDGYGIFAAMAPHRHRQPAIVSSADSTVRAAAPGSLMSILGQAVTSARSGDRAVPVLGSSNGESQVQVPFEIQGRALPLRLENGSAGWNLSVPLDEVSPAIFIDGDGSPMLLDGDSGVLLDAMNPARSGTRLQILATGLGRVKPDWPTGLAAPLDNAPAVVAPVRAFLDGQPLSVSRATLAPGFIGFYLIEIDMPALVNAGSAELYIEAGDRASNRVRVYIEP